LCDDLTARIFEGSGYGLASNIHSGVIAGRKMVTVKMSTLFLFCKK
jgi:hypothetical protein